MALMPVSEALAHIVEGIVRLDAEVVSIYDAAERVLAEDIHAKLTQPPFAASAMDGYAVRAADLKSIPVRLRLVGRSAAGHGFAGEVGPGQAVRIFTGAPVPAGADTVVIQENTKTLDDETVEILDKATLGRHVRPFGYDFKEGENLLFAGTRLGSRQLMLAAAMNHATVPVRRRPIIAVLANGDELLPPGNTPNRDQIISSIPAGIKAAILAWGGEPLILPIALDSEQSLSARTAEASHADVLLTIGGASVGEHDLVQKVLEGLGARFEVLKVAMRPGKPVMSGQMGHQRVLSLPGNPASALICARVFLKPLIDHFLGLRRPAPLQQVPLANSIEANGEREHYMRARFLDDGVSPLPDQDSSLINALAKADCLLVRPAFAPALPKGSLVPIVPFDF